MLSMNWPEGVLSELLHAGDLFLKSEIIKGLRNNFLKGSRPLRAIFER